MIQRIPGCRVCSNETLKTILNFGDIYVSDFVDREGQGFKAPLELVLCNKEDGGCGLLQLAHTVQPEKMYFQYWYQSGLNESMRKALKNIVENVEKRVVLGENDAVLDIGCNDGTLLRSYNGGVVRVGIDPARNLRPLAEKGTTKIVTDFFNAEALAKELPGKRFKAITAIAMFYDLDDPNSFVTDITKVLDRNGVFVIQMMSLPLMLKTAGFDNICHEHLEYYSLNALMHLLARHDLEVFDAEENEVNGGSIRAYIRFGGTTTGDNVPGGAERVRKILDAEEEMGLGKMETYQRFADNVEKRRQEVSSFIRSEAEKGKKIYVYGASTKGNTLLPVFGIDRDVIVAALERNPDKYGKLTVGTWIPIIPEEEGRKANPDYLFVLPWHFLDAFLKREKDYLESGGKFIVPLPTFRIIGKEDLS